ncbi:hypothetical protein D9756_007175 [Leucocoprinus leucothites]|uniref:Multifunctional tryptophan biosynthesis protein n=1 Tax=Leucocoprinus leucothites TaxID=201217 RepID=A0A8H5D5G0_9AGAR|nr:hypothetical protein D9756_007175 [Leucoagaricus leucothites]
MSKPPTILEKIYAQRAQDVEIAKQTPGTTPADLERLLSMHLAPPLVPLVERLRRNPSNALSGSHEIPSPSLMAEIKRASPSKGAIALTTPVAQQALIYALAGASVISVLTEPHWFKGSLHDMLMVRQSISSIPDRPAVLRKEFILDEYQIAEARLHGADTVLLIVAMMNDELLTRLYKYSLSLGMEPLVEVNNADEMRRALAIGAKVIGVNNRNLHDFNVDMGTTSRLVDMVKDRDIILCALSGISAAQDVRTYKDQGVKAVLVGESLMRAKDTAAFIRELLDWPDLQRSGPKRGPIVKVSGVTSTDQAQKLVNAGASILGFNFDPTLAGSITIEQAQAIRTGFPRTTANPVPTPSQQPNAPWFPTHLDSILSQCTYQRPLLVGHFTTHASHTLAFILVAIAAASLDLVQFDGAIPTDWARFLPVPVIRRFSSPLPPQSKGVETVATTATTTAIIQGINDASQISRPGLHAVALVDLTVASGSTTVFIPSGKGNPSPEFVPSPALDKCFNLARKDRTTPQPSGDTLKGVEETKKLVAAAELGGKWPMPVLVTGGRERVEPEVIRGIGAWGVDIDAGASASGLEEYIKSLQ